MKQNTEIVRKYELEGPNPGSHVLLLAGVHGDEYEPMVACRQLLLHLKGKLLNGKITFVPNANSTAYLTAARYGDDGLDMARICPGKEDGSSSEQAAHAVSDLIRNADYLVDMHTGGVMYDIFPLAGYMLHADPQVLGKQRQMALSYRLPLVWGTDSLPEGRTLSIARDTGVPAIYLEYGGGTGFRQEVVEAYTDGFLNLLRSLQMIPGDLVAPEIEKTWWVEDFRQDSGFLQGKMPAPASGIFIAEVTMGTSVKRGDPWGRIVDASTGEVTAVVADTDGLVFLLRNLVKVVKGDALGGIIPVTNPGRVTIDLSGNIQSQSTTAPHIEEQGAQPSPERATYTSPG